MSKRRRTPCRALELIVALVFGGPYAREDNLTAVRPFSGNSSHILGQQVTLRDFESQKKKAAVGMTISYPPSERFADRHSPDDVTVELVCLKVNGGSGRRQEGYWV